MAPAITLLLFLEAGDGTEGGLLLSENAYHQQHKHHLEAAGSIHALF